MGWFRKGNRIEEKTQALSWWIPPLLNPVWYLKTLEPKSRYSDELLQGLKDLMEGRWLPSCWGWPVMGSLHQWRRRCIYVGALEIHPKNHKVLCDGARGQFNPKEFDILYFLAKNKGNFSPRNRFTRQFGQRIILWQTAISWPLSESSEKDWTKPGCAGIHPYHMGNRL